MKKYKKKPKVVEAIQITKEFLKAVLFNDKPYPKGLRLSSASYHKEDGTISSWVGKVTTIHGQETRVEVDDWIIAEPKKEHFYPCKPDIFDDTYDEVT